MPNRIHDRVGTDSRVAEEKAVPTPTLPAVLLIAHAFPPAAGVGVLRSLGFARHLSASGWWPVVLTAVHPDQDAGADDALVARLGGELDVVRARALAEGLLPARGPSPAATGSAAAAGREISRLRLAARRWLLVPDEAAPWLLPATVAGLRAIRAHDVQALYSTSGPPTDHLVALLLHIWTGLPWVADFRDPWTAAPNIARRQIYASQARFALDRFLERHVLCTADRVVAVSEPQRRLLLDAARPGLTPSRARDFRVIANGYEPEDLASDGAATGSPMTLVYTGSFYRSGETPEPVFRAIASMRLDGLIPDAELRVRVLGGTAAQCAADAERLGIGDLVLAEGPVPHHEAVAAQHAADLLWLSLSPTLGSQGALTQKIYEYMAARRPVLAVVPPDSEAARLVLETGIGRVAAPDDVPGVRRLLEAWLAEHRHAGHLRWPGREEATDIYARPRLAAELAALLDEVRDASDRWT